MTDREFRLLDDPQDREDAARAEELRHRFDGLCAVQRSERYLAHSARQEVTATVDGTGSVLDLRIDDHALRRGHPGRLGVAIMQAVGAARTQAAMRARQLIMSALSDETGPATAPGPLHTDTPPPPAPAMAVRGRRPPPISQDEDESFDIFAGHRPGWMRR